MGTVVTRRRKDGTESYLAQIIIKRDGKVVHQEAKTFDRKTIARAWIAKRETELRKPNALEQVKRGRFTLADAIDRYIDESLKEIGKTKRQVLNTTKTYPIAAKGCGDITSQDIVAFATDLSTKAAPSTVGNYMSHLAAVFSVARPAWGYPLDRQAMDDAWIVLKRLGIAGKSRQRDRRPTIDELDRIMAHFADRQIRRPSSVPMVHITAFAIFSTRRQEEIVRITWADLDEGHARVLVRDMKNPGDKIGNDVWCDLPPEALRIIQAMPKSADQIFPYTTDAVGAAFTRACQILEIEDLRFHDLRHDGISRLFELGWNIPHVTTVSAHRSWTSLKRYTHIRQTGDKYAGWKWLDAATTTPNLRLTQKGSLPRRLRSER